MSKKKKVFATSAAAVLAASAVTPAVTFAAEKTFPDVKDDAWYADAVNALLESGVIQGDQNGNFNPDKELTRAEGAEFLYKALGLSAEGTEDYPDVEEDHWFYDAVVATTAAGIFEGNDAGEFMPKDELDRQQAAVALVRAFGLEGSADLSFEDADDIASWAKDAVAAAVENGVIEGKPGNKFAPTDTITRAEFAVMVKRAMDAVAPVKFEVVSAEAVNAKTLKVVFNDTVSEEMQKELSFTVKRNGVTTIFKVDKYDGNAVTLVRSTGADLLAGTYEITVSGLEEGVNNVVTTEVKEQALTSIEISANFVLADSVKSNLGIKALDQYGEEMPITSEDFTVSVKNITKNLPTEQAEFDSEGKFFYIDTRGVSTSGERYYHFNDEVRVTVVHNDTGITATKILTVNEAAELASIEFGDVELPEDAERLSQDVKEVKIPYTAKDQYGNDVELSTDLVTLGSSNSKVLDVSGGNVTFEKDEDGKKYILIKKFEDKGEVVLRIISNQTGKVFNYELEVLQKAGTVHGVELGTAELNIAEEDTAIKTVDLKVTDSYGAELDPEDYSISDFTINSSNNDIAVAGIVTKDNYESLGLKKSDIGKLWVAGSGKEGQVAEITVKVNDTEETATLTVSIGEKAVVSSLVIDEDSKHNTNLIVGAETTVKFAALDQYDNDAKDSDELSVIYEVANDGEEIELDKTSSDDITNATVKVTAKKAGKATLVAKLVENAGTENEKIIDKVSIEFKVAANNTENFTFEVADIPTLYKDGTSIEKYQKAVTVIAKDENGDEYALPADAVVSVRSSNDTLVGVKKKDDGWFVFGNDADTSNFGEKGDEDQIVTLTILFNADNEIKTITKDVVVSADELEADKVEFYDKAVSSNEVDSEANAVKNITVTSFSDLTSASVYVTLVDQFGVYLDSSSVTVADSASKYGEIEIEIISGEGYTDKNNDDVITLNNGALNFENLKDNVLEEGETTASLRILVTTDNNKVGFIDVTVGDE